MKPDLATLEYIRDLLERQGFPRAAVVLQGECDAARSSQAAEAAATKESTQS